MKKLIGGYTGWNVLIIGYSLITLLFSNFGILIGFVIDAYFGGESGSPTRLHRFRVYVILPIHPPRINSENYSKAIVNIVATPICSGS